MTYFQFEKHALAYVLYNFEIFVLLHVKAAILVAFSYAFKA